MHGYGSKSLAILSVMPYSKLFDRSAIVKEFNITPRINPKKEFPFKKWNKDETKENHDICNIDQKT